MNPAKDLTGHVYGNLTVLARADKKATYHGAFWLCLCRCGKQKVISANNLKTSNSKSCGCLRQLNGKKRE